MKTIGTISAAALVAGLASAAFADSTPTVRRQPNLNSDIAAFALDPEAADPVLSHEETAKLVRDRIKYVFVIFNENESFDHEFGGFPGADGLYSDGARDRAPEATPGFTQTYRNAAGEAVTVRPFRIGPNENATFSDSVDHSHKGLARKLHVTGGVAAMDGFAADEYAKYAKGGAAASGGAEAMGGQFARLVMSHVDCDTIPFLWRYANRFTLFDNIFATEDTPSTPNAIAMLAGQGGESQWVEHGAKAAEAPISGAINGATFSGAATPASVPVFDDPQPWWGSAFDPSAAPRQPTAPREFWAPANTAENLTFASLPLTLAGGDIEKSLSGDRDPAHDLADLKGDIPFIAGDGRPAVGWRWYQNGYGASEPNEPGFAPASPHANYVSHHNGAQYFGYIADNASEASNLRGEQDFFDDLAKGDLPPGGGVIYIRGGYYNLDKLTPPIQNPGFPAKLTQADIGKIAAAKSGDDDHPGYSDHQIAEAMNARVINAIAARPEIWAQSAIVIAYDESDGFYDHAPPRILSYGPDGLPLARGVRIPLILISPFARAGAVSHAEGDHNAVIETINAIYGLPNLSSLPDEMAALRAGDAEAFNAFAKAYGPADFHQTHLGPRDENTPATDSLLSGFSPQRLKGLAPPLPASYAAIPEADVLALPHYGGKGCETLKITPTDAGLRNEIPPGFNTLPMLLPAYN